MNTKTYSLSMDLTLSPVWYNEYPEIGLEFSQQRFFTGPLTKKTTFNITKQVPSGDYSLSVHFFNKKENDTIPEHNLDKGVIIESVSLNSITSPTFVWAAKYYPIYTDGWIKQQQEKEQYIQDELLYCNYMGWNGCWKLELSVPIFTWIHHKENLGWIYE